MHPILTNDINRTYWIFNKSRNKCFDSFIAQSNNKSSYEINRDMTTWTLWIPRWTTWQSGRRVMIRVDRNNGMSFEMTRWQLVYPKLWIGMTSCDQNRRWLLFRNDEMNTKMKSHQSARPELWRIRTTEWISRWRDDELTIGMTRVVCNGFWRWYNSIFLEPKLASKNFRPPNNGTQLRQTEETRTWKQQNE